MVSKSSSGTPTSKKGAISSSGGGVYEVQESGLEFKHTTTTTSTTTSSKVYEPSTPEDYLINFR